MVRFFIVITIVTAALIGVTVVGAGQGYFERPSFLYGTIAVLYIVTGAIFAFLSRLDKPESFLQLYLLTMVAKLIIFFLFNLIMVFADEGLALENVVFFMVTYFVFTAIEVAFLYGKISRSGKP